MESIKHANEVKEITDNVFEREQEKHKAFVEKSAKLFANYIYNECILPAAKKGKHSVDVFYHIEKNYFSCSAYTVDIDVLKETKNILSSRGYKVYCCEDYMYLEIMWEQ